MSSAVTFTDAVRFVPVGSGKSCPGRLGLSAHASSREESTVRIGRSSRITPAPLDCPSNAYQYTRTLGVKSGRAARGPPFAVIVRVLREDGHLFGDVQNQVDDALRG